MLMSYNDTLKTLESMPAYQKIVVRPGRQCEREVLRRMAFRKANGDEVSCTNCRKLDFNEMAFTFAEYWLKKSEASTTGKIPPDAIDFTEVCTGALMDLIRVQDGVTKARAIDILRHVLNKDVDPFTFRQLGKHGVTVYLMDKIIELSNPVRITGFARQWRVPVGATCK